MKVINFSYEALDGLIADWHNQCVESMRAADKIYELFGAAPESCAMKSISDLIALQIDFFEKVFGIGGWLDWWAWDCGFGKNPHEACLKGEELKLISTVDDLIKIIIADLKTQQV